MNTGPGIFGPRTEAALKAFQAKHKLPRTGVYDAKTAAALNKALASAPKPKTPSKPSSSSSVPLWWQGDSRWGKRTLGKKYTIHAAGCAMTATAMAISKISGKTINPAQLDHYLDTHHGYSGDALMWDVAARSVGLHAAKVPWSLSTINAQLAAGRPVVIGVNYKPGSGGGANGTDHWVTIVGKTVKDGKTLYKVHDPGTGKVTWLKAVNGKLYSASGGGIRPYNSTGQLVVFRK
ncbi:MAG: peptidoglycan-binding protein [Myxococcaceae bacterium]|nr:peptidoglycan-binding protein [Myxococcaceae bacterium]